MKTTTTILRIASVLLVALLITNYAVSGALAKYTHTSTGTVSADIAKWAFTIGKNSNTASNDSLTDSEKFTFELFSHLHEREGDTWQSEEDVATGSEGSIIIAPGMLGWCDLFIENQSDVNATCYLDFTEDTKGVPLRYQIKVQTYYKDNAEGEEKLSEAKTYGWSNTAGNGNLDSIEEPLRNTGIFIPMKNGIEETGGKIILNKIKIQLLWEWPIGTNEDVGADDKINQADTALGKTAETIHPTVTATVTVTQKD